MKNISLLICAIAFVLTVHGQTNTTFNTIYFEVGGNALFTSVNYERSILKKRKLNFHIGAGIYGIQPSYLTIPFGLNYLFPLHPRGSYIDLGFGATYTLADVKLYSIVDRKDPGYVNTNYWNYIPAIGYRGLTRAGVMYRFSLTPVINHNGVLPYAGFSIGKSF